MVARAVVVHNHSMTFMKRLAGAVCMTPSLEGGCDGPAFRRSKWGALRRRELLAGAGAAIAGTAVAAERADAFPPAETGGTRATPGASRPTRRSTTTTSGWWLKGRRAMQQTDLSRAASCIATDDGERQIRMDDRLPAAHSLAMAGPAATLLLASLLSARSLRGGEPAGGPSSLEERARPPTTIALHRAPVSILGVCRAALGTCQRLRSDRFGDCLHVARFVRCDRVRLRVGQLIWLLPVSIAVSLL